jgi:hypothetical protein
VAGMSSHKQALEIKTCAASGLERFSHAHIGEGAIRLGLWCNTRSKVKTG